MLSVYRQGHWTRCRGHVGLNRSSGNLILVESAAILGHLLLLLLLLLHILKLAEQCLLLIGLQCQIFLSRDTVLLSLLLLLTELTLGLHLFIPLRVCCLLIQELPIRSRTLHLDNIIELIKTAIG